MLQTHLGYNSIQAVYPDRQTATNEWSPRVGWQLPLSPTQAESTYQIIIEDIFRLWLQHESTTNLQRISSLSSPIQNLSPATCCLNSCYSKPSQSYSLTIAIHLQPTFATSQRSRRTPPKRTKHLHLIELLSTHSLFKRAYFQPSALCGLGLYRLHFATALHLFSVTIFAGFYTFSTTQYQQLLKDSRESNPAPKNQI